MFADFIKTKKSFNNILLTGRFYDFYKDAINDGRIAYNNSAAWKNEEIKGYLDLGREKFCEKIIDAHFCGKINIFADFG